jgi:hypothetical protein
MVAELGFPSNLQLLVACRSLFPPATLRITRPRSITSCQLFGSSLTTPPQPSFTATSIAVL